jgi:hypothetical protein
MFEAIAFGIHPSIIRGLKTLNIYLDFYLARLLLQLDDDELG